MIVPDWVCPFDGGTLGCEEDELVCPAAHRFRVERGIPRFVEGERYVAGFGRQWLRFQRTQLDSHTGLSLSRDRARRCIGEEEWARLGRATVLECGCGAGRFTETLLAAGAHVTSIDLSVAVDANAANLPQNSRHRIAQADILQLPFAPGGFDLVFCLGVVQHTPSPEATIASLLSHVKPGGLLVFDCYTRSFAWTLSLRPIYRWLVLRLPAQRAEALVERFTLALLPLHRQVAHTPTVRRLLNRVSPVISFYNSLPLSDELQREWALLDTHDSLTDRYKHRRTCRAVSRELQALDASAIHCSRGGNGIEVRARPSPRAHAPGPAVAPTPAEAPDAVR